MDVVRRMYRVTLVVGLTCQILLRQVGVWQSSGLAVEQDDETSKPKSMVCDHQSRPVVLRRSSSRRRKWLIDDKNLS